MEWNGVEWSGVERGKARSGGVDLMWSRVECESEQVYKSVNDEVGGCVDAPSLAQHIHT